MKKLKDTLMIGTFYAVCTGCLLLVLFGLPGFAHASGQVDLGAKLDDGDLSITTSLDYSWIDGNFEKDIEFDYRFKNMNDLKTTNKGLIAFKQRYEFKPKHYTFGLVRYDYNEFRPITDRRQVNIGWGYKLIRSDKIKMSNEFAVGYLNSEMGQGSDSVNEILFRNSLWFFYKLAPKLNFTNKFLYEASDTPLIRNETAFNYLLTDKIKISIKNVYTEDPDNSNFLSFNVGYIF